MIRSSYDVIVVGGGHAGCEAALASARRGYPTILLTMSVGTIGLMSCNPAVGGLAKGQLVKETDALGGEMAKATDDTCIQFRRLNSNRGYAVRSSRAQVDRRLYRLRMLEAVTSQPNLFIEEGEVAEIVAEGGRVAGVVTTDGRCYSCRALVITPGTFLRGLMHTGLTSVPGGRAGDPPAMHLSSALSRLGLILGRLKTGTTPRLDGRTIDFSRLQVQHGDDRPVPFSLSRKGFPLPQVPCHITYTNAETHRVIREGLSRSPLYTGIIKGVGPRYCPSIEDKVVRFPQRGRHQVFLEPEGLNTTEVYPNGLATSLPIDVQERMLRTIEGLEQVEIIRPGYAVEYDFVQPTQLKPSFETRAVRGLFLAGQINGTSGYEEAAAQGLMAGINATLHLEGAEPVVLSRSQAYIGVLIDDLVTKGTSEPYRMFTSRAEHRLLLREDNTDLRLREIGYRLGLVNEEDYRAFKERERAIVREHSRLQVMKANGDPGGLTLAQLLKRPGVTYDDLAGLDSTCPPVSRDVAEAVEVQVKYEGYIAQEERRVERLSRLEGTRIPEGFDYGRLSGLSAEVREKLASFRPVSIGQASRISGVTPAALSVLMVHLRRPSPSYP